MMVMILLDNGGIKIIMGCFYMSCDIVICIDHVVISSMVVIFLCSQSFDVVM